MRCVLKILIIVLTSSLIYSQTIYEETLYDNGEQLDVFAYQLPENFDSELTYPLLVAFHQWGGNHMSTFSTTFDEECNEREWIFLSPFGGSSNNYNHQGAQEMVKKAIEWIIDNYNINKNKIYMVGGSMGGASGMIYANNHLNPEEPMVAATASASGILDCERRAIEMDGNNSMTEWFGGNYDEVPFEYHRNSAIYFSDFYQSMHYNLQYTPLYFDFGVTEPHRTHAEEMYQVMSEAGYNQNMWIDENPTGSHGFSVFDENHVCNWLEQFELNDDPDYINVNLDESSRAYWIEVNNYQQVENEFMRITASRETYQDSLIITIEQTYNITDNNITLHVMDELYDYINLYYNGVLEHDNTNAVGITGDVVDYITHISVNDCDYCIDWVDDVIWVYLQDENSLLEIFYPNDINNDGNWNILDILLTINIIMDQYEPNAEESFLADMNQDGTINILDILMMVNFILLS